MNPEEIMLNEVKVTRWFYSLWNATQLSILHENYSGYREESRRWVGGMGRNFFFSGGMVTGIWW